MLELSSARKNKVHLTDYDWEQDIQNRMMMADFSSFDLEVLEEILFSPLRVSVKKLARHLECEEEDLLGVAQKLSEGGLLTMQGDTLLVDKEKRKYFEFQISRFNPEFKPDIEFLLGVLKKVPIHILPTWYSIPRTSNNIFESILEKYLLTPQIYQRYLSELHFSEPVVNEIILDLFSSPNLQLFSSDLIARYNLSRRHFEEIMLKLEFHFVCCLVYEKEEDHWIESVAPFQEWKDYLSFLKKSEATPLDAKEVVRNHDSDFAFIQEITATLAALQKQPEPSSQFSPRVVEKLCLLQLAHPIGKHLHLLNEEWLDMSDDSRALFLYRHPLNRILSIPSATDKSVREAEKAIKRVLHGNWVLFDEFLEGTLVSLNEEPITLKRTGRHWKYTLPTYGEEEKALIKATFFEWLFEMGMVATGTYQGRDCFCVTPFGRSFFEE